MTIFTSSFSIPDSSGAARVIIPKHLQISRKHHIYPSVYSLMQKRFQLGASKRSEGRRQTSQLSLDLYLMTNITVSADGAVVSQALPVTFLIPLLLFSGVRVEDPGVAGLS